MKNWRDIVAEWPEERRQRHEQIKVVLDKAEEVLGDKWEDWIDSPCSALGGLVPFEMLDTAIGQETVMQELGRIEHGVFA